MQLAIGLIGYTGSIQKQIKTFQEKQAHPL